jgi:integrative and conjugative element protein (TIGR02256 family)
MAEPRLYVHRGALQRFEELPQRPWEVGGWLLGYSDEEANSLVLTHATPPSRGTPFFVRISGRHHRPYFDQAWSATSGLITFVGDWHTHPGGHPTPSERDEAAMRQLHSDPDYGEGPLLTAIAGTGRWPGRRRLTDTRFFTLRREEPVRLRPVLLDDLPDPAHRVPNWRWPTGRR